MELRQLEAFAAVMSTGSVTAAGRLLGRSQPAISRLLQELEAEIGYALFARSGPRVTPTEQGFLLYDDVERALSSLRQIRDRAEEIARGQAQPLLLAATSALAAGLVPDALKRIEAQAGNTRVQLRSASPERVVHAVLSGAAQLGATSLPLEHRGLTVHWIGQAPCVVALPENDPAARHEVVPVAELAGRRVITMANPYRLRRRLDAALGHAAGAIETNSSVNALAAVRAGLGVSVLEPITAYGAPMAGVAIRPIDLDIPFFFGVITSQSQPLTPACQAMADALAQAAAQLLPGFVLHDACQHGALLQSIYGDETPLTDTPA
ncbi:LysR family transcriptional regulator [Achromobacter xylosoxidans]|uniref:LysR family transcriptional regulator n=4 Tax=Alcaligenes xylosoxydans xylosoxydans TaxID=85698 RepID=UPI0001F439A6|nr:LysR family transcriptional regulator [Achromobacter xylosoxidans]EFV84692.1 LysR-family transcriptional regulator [Achromobacter xylosoxidans C54]KWU22011.1 LysR family transcriptional regulator [Achromobacter xylosoxidans]MCH1987464.1 LysR family transcriptional regulator [Achromobacter xylosoxidans]MCH1996749.1 LysR family transcriptional regulator [Achromobacter xylosoxidans]MCH4586916.1 LysR family transcriptional regulator [Achromobacter xylosoxidans]